MPYKSDKQRRFFHANKAKLEAQGVDVAEWDAASKGKKLPEQAPEKKAAHKCPKCGQALVYTPAETGTRSCNFYVCKPCDDRYLASALDRQAEQKEAARNKSSEAHMTQELLSLSDAELSEKLALHSRLARRLRSKAAYITELPSIKAVSKSLEGAGSAGGGVWDQIKDVAGKAWDRSKGLGEQALEKVTPHATAGLNYLNENPHLTVPVGGALLGAGLGGGSALLSGKKKRRVLGNALTGALAGGGMGLGGLALAKGLGAHGKLTDWLEQAKNQLQAEGSEVKQEPVSREAEALNKALAAGEITPEQHRAAQEALTTTPASKRLVGATKDTLQSVLNPDSDSFTPGHAAVILEGSRGVSGAMAAADRQKIREGRGTGTIGLDTPEDVIRATDKAIAPESSGDSGKGKSKGPSASKAMDDVLPKNRGAIFSDASSRENWAREIRARAAQAQDHLNGQSFRQKWLWRSPAEVDALEQRLRDIMTGPIQVGEKPAPAAAAPVAPPAAPAMTPGSPILGPNGQPISPPKPAPPPKPAKTPKPTPIVVHANEGDIARVGAFGSPTFASSPTGGHLPAVDKLFRSGKATHGIAGALSLWQLLRNIQSAADSQTAPGRDVLRKVMADQK